MLNPDFSNFPILSTERLILRKISLDDQNEFFEMRADPRVMKYIGKPVMQKLEEATELMQKMLDSLEKNDGITWAITLKNDDKLIGTIGFWRLIKEHYRAEIGYTLRYDFQKKGYMPEALRAVLDYGFQQMNLHSVEAVLDPENSSSIKLIERQGFVREAYFKEDYFINGVFVDSAIYSLLGARHKA